ncbi:MAG: hypothetical protein EBZ59_12195, partial [Planctomycetia bacterium]|nr:hypothetical protein [Planctomycetia bacterium]
VEEAAAAARSVERSESRAYALLAVANAAVSTGDIKTALALLGDADKAADKVGDEQQRKIIVDKVRTRLAEVEKRQ